MNASIDLESKYFDIITQILRQCLPPQAKIWFFGSRTQGRSKPFSDVDILIDLGIPLSLAQLSELNMAFDESLLPYKVDIADAWTINESFKLAIQNQLIPVTTI